MAQAEKHPNGTGRARLLPARTVKPFISRYSQARRLTAEHRSCIGLDFNMQMSNMMRTSPSLALWKKAADDVFMREAPKSDPNSTMKSLWEKSCEYLNSEPVKCVVEDLVREADHYGQPGAAFTQRSHNKKCEDVFQQWRDAVGLGYPTEAVPREINVPSNLTNSFGRILCDMKSIQDAGIGKQGADTDSRMFEQYEQVEDLLDIYKDIGETPDWFKPDKMTKKSGGTRFVMQDMVASWIRVKMGQEGYADRTPEDLRDFLKEQLNGVLKADIIDKGYNDSITGASAVDQEANTDRAFIFSWCFKDMTWENVVKTTDRLESFITKPAQEKQAWVDSLNFRVRNCVQSASKHIKPMARGYLRDHTYQSPMLITSESFLNSLAVRTALNCPASILQSICSSDNPWGYLCLQYMTDIVTSDTVVGRNVYWMTQRFISGHWDPIKWTGKMKGNVPPAGIVEVKGMDIVVTRGLYLRMKYISCFADRPDEYIVNHCKIGTFNVARVFHV